MPTARPTVTDEHISKYHAIMGTPVASNALPAASPPPVARGNTSQSISSLLASLPKAKGIGNKMFVFTGKKKIIMDGSKQEVERIKTVDPKPVLEKETDAALKKAEEAHKDLAAKNIPTEEVEGEKTAAKPAESSNIKTSKKKLPMIFLVISGVIFLSAWGFFWLVLFGYIKF